MELVTGVLVGLAVADAIRHEGEVRNEQHDGQTRHDPSVCVAHASSSAPFPITTSAAPACNASGAPSRGAPDASNHPRPSTPPVALPRQSHECLVSP
jgi:hypothetical protein